MLDIVNILQYIAEIRCDKTINCIESAIDCLIWLLDRWAFETGILNTRWSKRRLGFYNTKK